MGSIDTLRDALYGNPPTPTKEPSREGVLAAITELKRDTDAGIAAAALSGTDLTAAMALVQPLADAAAAAEDRAEVADAKADSANAKSDNAEAVAAEANAQSAATAASIGSLVKPTTAPAKRVPVVVDAAGNVPVWLVGALLDAVGLGPRAASSIGIKLTARPTAGKVALVVDEAGNVPVWLQNGKLDAVGLGPRLLAELGEASATGFYYTDGTHLKRSRAAIGHLSRASVRLIGWHYLLYGASHTERIAGPQAVVNDFLTRGVPIVATGWISLATSSGSGRLGDGTQAASIVRTNTTTIDLQEQGASDGGQYSPEGFRSTWADGDTTAGATVVWKGKTLTLYHKANSAAFRHVTDGGTAVNTTTGTGGTTGKTVITAAAEGWHTTVFSRATNASGALEWYGLFAASALKGLTVSQVGNGGSKFSDFNAAMATAAAQYILADIAPDQMMIDLIGNDATAGTSGTDPAVVAANFTTLVGQLRAVRPGVELLLPVKPQNGVAGVTEGRPFADYVPGLLAACEALGVDMIDHGALLPDYAGESFFYVSDQRHFEPTAGAPEILAAAERRAFWETL